MPKLLRLTTPRVVPDEPLQRINQETPETPSVWTHTVYLQANVLAALSLGYFKGKRRVRSRSPEDWPYSPEPECLEDWAETEE